MFRNRDWDDIPDDFLLPPGSADRGAKLFKKHCRQCHSMRPDNRQTSGFSSIGPTLFNVYGRTSGIQNVGGLNMMTTSMKSSGIVWNDANLMRYMKNPTLFVDAKIGMNFSGLPKFQDRVDIVHFLRDLNYEGKYGKEILKECENQT
ncbi:cytochrome C [Theileria orientalis]|uniref:Cytochrome C n=1 Tax=Theileria orientalis TaxID=68886 RepID=A0A976SJQ8_THEOR|nr:cytochrome C [Theileria orientalis]